MLPPRLNRVRPHRVEFPVVSEGFSVGLKPLSYPCPATKCRCISDLGNASRIRQTSPAIPAPPIISFEGISPLQACSGPFPGGSGLSGMGILGKGWPLQVYFPSAFCHFLSTRLLCVIVSQHQCNRLIAPSSNRDSKMARITIITSDTFCPGSALSLNPLTTSE